MNTLPTPRRSGPLSKRLSRRSLGSLPLLAALLAAAVARAGPWAADRVPRVIPFPAPPPGPVIRKVTHDALRPVKPGAHVVITVLSEAGVKVKATLVPAVQNIACVPAKSDAATYLCETTIPAGASGPLRARAEAVDSKGRTSTLGAAIPVVVEKSNPKAEADALNVRLVPAWFAAGSAEIDEESKTALAKDADLLKSRPDRSVVLEGRADPEEADPDGLSKRRAEAVLDLLASLGVPRERLRVSPLGATQPMVNVKDPTADRRFNRVVLVLFEPAPATSPSAR